MFKSLLLSLLFLLSFKLLADCPVFFDKANLCAALEWTHGPYLGEKSHFTLSFWSKDDASMTPIEPNFNIKIYSWMLMSNGHNHGGPKMTAVQTSLGVYRVEDARFFMHGMDGSWQVRVDLRDLDDHSVIEKRSWDINFLND